MNSLAATKGRLTVHSLPFLSRERRMTDFPFIAAIRGRVGDRVFKTYRDKIIVTRVPRFDNYVPTSAQRARRDRMRVATAFAQRIYANAATKAFYVAAAQKLGRQPFRLAISDYLSNFPAARERLLAVLRLPGLVLAAVPLRAPRRSLARYLRLRCTAPGGKRQLRRPRHTEPRLRRDRHLRLIPVEHTRGEHLFQHLTGARAQSSLSPRSKERGPVGATASRR